MTALLRVCKRVVSLTNRICTPKSYTQSLCANNGRGCVLCWDFLCKNADVVGVESVVVAAAVVETVVVLLGFVAVVVGLSPSPSLIVRELVS